MGELAAPIAVDLSELPGRADRARVRFVTPTELKSEHQGGGPPEFGSFVRAVARSHQHAPDLYGLRAARHRFPRDG